MAVHGTLGDVRRGHCLGFHDQLAVHGGIGFTAAADVAVEGSSFGTAVVDFDFKLRNPNYDPPDPIGSGIIPGFTWLVAIPALIGAAAVGLVIRKRK